MAQMKLPPGAELVEDKLPPGAEDADKLPGEKELLSRPDLASPPAVQPPPVQRGQMDQSMTAHAMSPTESVSHPGEGNFVAEHPEQGDTLRTGAAIGAFGPLPVAGGYLGSMLGGYGGRKLGEAAGMSPENVGRMETGGNVVGGMVGGMGGGAVQSGMGKIGSAMMQNPGRVAQTAVRGALDQPIINHFTKAWEESGPPEVGAQSPIVVRPGPDVGFKEAMPKVGAKSARVVGPGFGSADATVGAVKKLPVHPGIEPISPAAPPAAPAPLPETMIAPVPRSPIPGVPPGSMQSVPRPDLPGHVLSGQPGAAEAFQAIGGKPIFLTPGAQFEMAQPGVASGRPPVQHMPTLSSYGQSVYPAGYAPEVPMANSAPVPQITGPEMMNRLNAYGAGPAHPSAAPMIRNVMVPLEGESGMPKFNERGQRLGIEPINAPEGSAQEVNKADHPDYNEKGQKLGTPPQEDEDVGAKVRRENPEPTRAEVEEGERKKKSGSK